jgi:hypothetical protein
VVRRLNEAVGRTFNDTQHRFVIEAGIRSRLAGATTRPLELPPEHLGWARSYGERLVAELGHRDLTVHGDLSDLVPADVAAAGPALDAVTDAELLDATQAALASMALDHGRLFRRYRRAFAEREGRLPGPTEVLTSQLRAGGFWMRKRAVHHADRHPLVARASQAYLGRTSPTSRW